MKRFMILLMGVAAGAFLAGCVVFPHGELVAPAASGRVLDAQSLRPVRQARVTRRVDAWDRTCVTFTDDRGAFELRKDTDLRWIPFVCYAASAIRYRIDANGYSPFTTNRYGGGSFHRGRSLHDLGQVLLRKNSE